MSIIQKLVIKGSQNRCVNYAELSEQNKCLLNTSEIQNYATIDQNNSLINKSQNLSYDNLTEHNEQKDDVSKIAYPIIVEENEILEHSMLEENSDARIKQTKTITPLQNNTITPINIIKDDMQIKKTETKIITNNSIDNKNNNDTYIKNANTNLITSQQQQIHKQESTQIKDNKTQQTDNLLKQNQYLEQQQKFIKQPLKVDDINSQKNNTQNVINQQYNKNFCEHIQNVQKQSDINNGKLKSEERDTKIQANNFNQKETLNKILEPRTQTITKHNGVFTTTDRWTDDRGNQFTREEIQNADGGHTTKILVAGGVGLGLFAAFKAFYDKEEPETGEETGTETNTNTNTNTNPTN